MVVLCLTGTTGNAVTMIYDVLNIRKTTSHVPVPIVMSLMRLSSQMCSVCDSSHLANYKG